ncbi:MAG: winged helix-turn-helix domain-containing protein, partial [Xanthomonadales bacterium]|nr:winged helix-turn-helix domain-containing protein [Xanthomonadales bacterium]
MGEESPSRALFHWTFATAKLDESTRQLSVDGVEATLEPRPLELLGLLLHHAGEVLTKEELLEAAWEGRPVVDGALTNAIGKLRRVLGDVDQTIIETVPRVGYRLTGKVTRQLITRGAISNHFKAGDAVPDRAGWRLVRPLDSSERGEVWLAAHEKSKAQRVFKYSFDGSRLYALKREVTISRLLRESLGERAEFVPVLDWDFGKAPYFIEAIFGGERMDEWAAAHGGLGAIALDTRIELLARIADAVAMAHEVGVLHKDLKPANILINGPVDDPQPSLVDFGSGKLMDPERLKALSITGIGMTKTGTLDAESTTGTPLYLAPELISAGQTPTVRSDIYALGVVLYQLCAGDFRRPMSAGWEDDIDDALLREDIAAAANGNPELRPASARELALRLRNREQRALQREREIAAARQTAINERALAAARARRPWVLAGVGLLAIGCVVTWTMYQRVAEANVRAVREMRVAQAVNQFLNQDLLTTANPVHGGRANIPLIEAIDRAGPAIQSRFSDDPQVAATIHQTLGDAYYQLANYDKAREQFSHAAARFSQLGDNAAED